MAFASAVIDLGTCDDPEDTTETQRDAAEAIRDQLGDRVQQIREAQRAWGQQNRLSQAEYQRQLADYERAEKEAAAIEEARDIPAGPVAMQLAQRLVADYGGTAGVAKAEGLRRGTKEETRAYTSRQRELQRQMAGTRGIGAKYRRLYTSAIRKLAPPKPPKPTPRPQLRGRISFDGQNGQVCICSGPGNHDCRSRKLYAAPVRDDQIDAMLEDPLGWYMDHWGGEAFVGYGAIQVTVD